MMKNPFFLLLLLLATALLLPGLSTAAAPETSRACRIIVNAADGKVLIKEGPCDVRRTPCSTFKIPLAVMGYDAGILKNDLEPAWDYQDAYDADRADDRQRINPTSWEKLSVLWYSRKLTETMGMATLQKYVNQFHYGNQDLSGDPGKDNGIRQSWVMSSLLISPDEQMQFLQKFFKRELGVSDHAYTMTEKILPEFRTEDGWIVKGKTGSGFQKKPDGSWNRQLHEGWFIGWATKGNQRILLVQSLVDDSPSEGYAGPRCREAFLKALPDLMR